MTQGVATLLCSVGPGRNTKFAERVAVCLHSLRQHWPGRVTLFVCDDLCEEIGNRLKASLGIDVCRKEKVGSHYATKTLIPAWTPYENTLFLDGDTITVGAIDELFTQAPLTLTHFSDWVSTGNRMRRRILTWKGVSPYIDALVEQQLSKPHMAINTGVFAWTGHGGEWAATWHEMTKVGKNFIADELAMQVLFPEIPGVRVVEDQWNCSPTYANNRRHARIWHFHGDKHLRKAEGRALWLPAFEAAMRDNVGGIREWAGKYDPWVRELLKKGES